MKYKLIKMFPTGGGFSVGSEFEANKSGFILINGLGILGIYPADWPEFFEPVKEPLFISEDGKEIYDDSHVWAVKIDSLKIVEDFNLNDQYINIYAIRNHTLTGKNWKYFSTKQAAEAWIEENKPVFSRKQINDAIIRTRNNSYFFPPEPSYSADLFSDLLKKHLGL